MAKRKSKILVVDNNDYFIEDLKEDPKAEMVEQIFATDGVELNTHLRDTTVSMMGIFINPVLPTNFDLGLIRACHQYRPSTPIYVIYDIPPPLSDQEFEQIGVQGVYKKPLTYTEMVDIVDPPLFDAEAALKVTEQFQEEVGQEIAGDEKEFKPIRATDFFSGEKSFFDVYVRLKSGKFIKILAAGDDFSKERVQNYLEKGVEYFYIRREAQEFYVGYCDKLAASLLKNNKIATSVKVKMIFNHGEETIAFLKSAGLSETNLYHASRYVANINDTIDKMRMKRVSVVKDFLSNVSMFDHGNSAAMLASLVLKPLNINDKLLRETVGFACMFHDIGLQGLPEKFLAEDESLLSEDELAVFHLHPTKGAEIIADIPNIDHTVVQAIEQHHERRGRTGFPNQLGGTAINTIAEVVGLADEFVRLIDRVKKDRNINMAAELNNVVYKGFSYKAVDAFNEGIFGIRPKTNL